MKLLLLDTGEVGLDIAFAAQRAGHDVRFWIPRKKGGTEREMGKGIVPRVKEWEPSMKWADLILPTDNCFYIKALEG
jgi:hypothetical protein